MKNKILIIILSVLFLTTIPSVIGINLESEYKVPSFDRMGLISSSPPVVEILYPQNGSIVYTRYSNISVKFSDDTGLTSFDLEYGGKHYTVGYGGGVYPPSKIFYLNRSMERIKRGYVWIVAKAYDEDGNIGIDTVIFYYDDSNDTDLFPPEIGIWRPMVGQIYILGRPVDRILDINLMNFSIVISKFEIVADIDDPEGHLQTVELYIDDELVYEENYTSRWWDFIIWDCDKFIIGKYEIKIVATDSYNNSAMEKLNCFIINFF